MYGCGWQRHRHPLNSKFPHNSCDCETRQRSGQLSRGLESGCELLPFEDCCVFQQERESRLALQAKIQIISTPNIDAASSMIKLGLHKYANKLMKKAGQLTHFLSLIS